MKTVHALPGMPIKFEEGEFYAYASLHLDGEGYSVRIPLGDGRYHATLVWERIVAPALGANPLENWKAKHGEPVAPIDFSEV